MLAFLCDPWYNVSVEIEKGRNLGIVEADQLRVDVAPAIEVVTPYTNPKTSKGWTDAEESVIASLMAKRSLERISAIQYARRHNLIGDSRIVLDQNPSRFTGTVTHDRPGRPARAAHNDQPNVIEFWSVNTPAVPSTGHGTRCEHCGLVLPNDVRAGARFCDNACKQSAYRTRKAVVNG